MALEKRQYLYALEFEIPDYENENIIWAEDLFDVDIIVYAGHIGPRLPGYSADKTEDYGLVIVRHKKNDIIVPVVRADPKSNRIYIPTPNFEKWWPDISRSIANYLLENGLPGKPGDHVDKTYMTACSNKKVHVSNEDREKQRLLDDYSIMYFEMNKNGVLHDRKCKCVKIAKGAELTGYTAFRSSMQLCQKCGYTIAVREMCLPKTKYISAIEKILRESGVSFARVQELAFGSHMKMDMISLMELTITVHDDTWRARKEGDTWRLWHNNYILLVEGVRSITDGFHDQRVCGTLTRVLNAADSYNWSQDHLKNAADKIRRLDDTAETADEVNIMGCMVHLDGYVPADRASGEITSDDQTEMSAVGTASSEKAVWESVVRKAKRVLCDMLKRILDRKDTSWKH